MIGEAKTNQAATKLIEKYGDRAKLEAMRSVVAALRTSDIEGEAFWRGVMECLFLRSQPSSTPQIHGKSSATQVETTVSSLRAAASQQPPPSAAEWDKIRALCGSAATHLSELEAMVFSVLRRDGDADPSGLRSDTQRT